MEPCIVLGFNTKLNNGTIIDKFTTSKSEKISKEKISKNALKCCLLVNVLEKKNLNTEYMYILNLLMKQLLLKK